MHVTIACLATLFHFCFPTLRVSSASDRHWGEKPMGTRLGRSHKKRATRVYSSCTIQSRRDARLYGRVQLRLSELLTSKPALFMNAKFVSSSSSWPWISCLLAGAHVSYSIWYGFLAWRVVLMIYPAVLFKALTLLVKILYATICAYAPLP